MPEALSLVERCRRLSQPATAPTPPKHKPFALPGDSLHHAPDRLADVQNIRIEVSFDIPAGKLFGTCTTTLAPINDGLQWMTFDAVEFTIKRVLVGGQQARYEYDSRELRVDVGRDRPAGEAFDILVEYECEPRRGVYFNRPDDGYPDKRVEIWTQGQDEDSRHWFPCHDFPNEKTRSEVIATVPASFFALSNGVLVSTTEDPLGHTRRFHWKQDKPHVYYLISLVAGEFVALPHEADGVPIVYYVPPGREEDGERSLGNTPEMMRFYNAKIGYPYPWDKYAQITVGDFIFGGMENTSATTLTDSCLFDARAALDYSSDPLVAHELAHQWFGDLLTCNEWAHGWLNEGFATYFEALFTEHFRGTDEFHWEMMQNAEIYMGEDSGRYRRPLVERTYNEPIDLFDRHLYEKGSLVLHQLRFILGEELWWKSINRYVTDNAFRNVVTLDLQRAIMNATGRNLEWFFDQWAYKGGHPEFKTSYEWDENNQLARLTINQTQTTDDITPIFRVPVDVDFYDSSGSVTRRRLEIKQQEERFNLALGFKPAAVVVDPDNWVLATAEFDKPKHEWEFILKHARTIKPRIRAVDGLAKIGSGSATQLIGEVLLNDPFWGVQARAAQALGKLRSEAARDLLLRALAEVQHPKARRAVAQALGEFRDDTVVDALIAKLQAGDESYFVESATAAALGATRNPRALPVLLETLNRDSFRDVIRAGVFAGLAALHDQDAIPTVLEWTAYGKPSFARESAISALGRLGKKDGLVKDQVVDRLIDLLHDPWLRVRIQAAMALGKLGDGRAVGPLQAYAARELDGRGIRIAREAVNQAREGGQNQEVGKLRQEVDDLVTQNRKLIDRLERLEARLGSTNGASGDQVAGPSRNGVTADKPKKSKSKKK